MENLSNINSPLVGDLGLIQLLTLLKAHLNSMQLDNTTAIEAVNQRINILVGSRPDGTVIDVTKAIDTFNEIVDFLEGVSDTTLDNLLEAIRTSVASEQTRAAAEERALGLRLTTLENITVMSADDVANVWNQVFNVNSQENG